MTILVTGGAGTVGSRIVRRLFDAQAPLRVLCHSEKGLARMPSPSIGVIADFDQPASLADSLKGVRTMMLITPMHPNEERRGLALVEAARRSGVEKIVYLTTIVRSGTEGALHYRSKRPVEEAIRQAGLDFVFLRPNSFHQNDVWLRSQIVENCVYTQPVGEVGVNRIDAGDVASAAAVVLTTSDHDGSDFELHGSRTRHRVADGGDLLGGDRPQGRLRGRRPDTLGGAKPAVPRRLDGRCAGRDVRLHAGARRPAQTRFRDAAAACQTGHGRRIRPRSGELIMTGGARGS